MDKAKDMEVKVGDVSITGGFLVVIAICSVIMAISLLVIAIKI